MSGFELVERDGLARIGRFDTPHGRIETPALLPVVHPDRARQPIPARDIRRRFGLSAVITSAYITYRTPALRDFANREGIHGLIDFDGPVMTDSGAFQQHAYGHVEVGAEEILSFQETVGSDIATVLDIFVEPGSSHEQASEGVDTTLARSRAARQQRAGLLAVPVQGGLFEDLRRVSAEGASMIGDILAIGGVVPLLEQYRFADLARTLQSVRPFLSPEKVVHLFGTGHPMTFAFAALFGVDLFDSSAYHKFARRGALLFPEGTVAIDELREQTCRCVLCSEIPLMEVATMPAGEREARIAAHNLLISSQEIAQVRQAIRQQSLWELAERRAAAHPALRAGIRRVVERTEIFLATEPESRPSFREIGETSPSRPSVRRFTDHVDIWRKDRGPWRTCPRRPMVPAFLRDLPAQNSTGAIWWQCDTDVGIVPLELTEIYPVGPYLSASEFESDSERHPKRGKGVEGSEVVPANPPEVSSDWLAAWTRRHVSAILEWEYGVRATQELLSFELSGGRARRTGRLRTIGRDNRTAFTVGNDGLPRPTWAGAQLLGRVLPSPTGRIVVQDDAVPFVAEGRSLFARFVRDVDPHLVPGGSALLVDAEGKLLAVGQLVLAPHEMRSFTRGVAARVTAHAASPTVHDPELTPNTERNA